MTPLINKSTLRRRGLTLTWEITIALAVKIILLWLLWEFFFSTPEAKHMHLPEEQVSHHLFSGNVVHHVNQSSTLVITSNSTLLPASMPK